MSIKRSRKVTLWLFGIKSKSGSENQAPNRIDRGGKKLGKTANVFYECPLNREMQNCFTSRDHF
jgi:hypothetical protein